MPPTVWFKGVKEKERENERVEARVETRVERQGGKNRENWAKCVGNFEKLIN